MANANSNNNDKAIPENAVVITSTKVKNALAAFIQAKADEKDAKERKAQAEAILRASLPFGKVIGIIGKIKAFSLVSSKTTSFDRELLETKYPEAYAATLRTTEYDYIRTA
jgi:hypothetical protein